jgi:hypothetical protein
MTPNSVPRRTLITGAAAVGLLAGVSAVGTVPAVAAPLRGPSSRFDARTVLGWARDTWHSLVAMTDEHTGLPADNIPASLAAGDRSGYTSPTNIGGYLWSAVVAEELGFIGRAELVRRCRQTLATIAKLGHHVPSGMYYNWYDEATGDVLTTSPDNPDQKIVPFLSSVDNGWLGAALWVVRNAVPEVRVLADKLFTRMRWDMFYDADTAHQGVRPGGLIHGGFYDSPPPDNFSGYTGNHIGVGPDVWYTNHHYDTTVSETRITSYLGIFTGQIPAKQYFAMWRTFPASCDWDWHESQPAGVTRTYLGLDVYEGAYTYRGMRIVPGWGGSMFEELMPDVFVPEARWAPGSWGRNHPLHVRAQREHGLVEAGYGIWGFSPASNPDGGYREYGVDALGLNPEGYFSDQEKTNYDPGFGTCRVAGNPVPDFGDGVATPHASFLAMAYEPRQAYANLVKLQHDYDGYGDGGFFDAIASSSRKVAKRYLSLDQAMIMGAVGNVLGRDVVRRAFATKTVERRLRPVLALERFGAGTD